MVIRKNGAKETDCFGKGITTDDFRTSIIDEGIGERKIRRIAHGQNGLVRKRNTLNTYPE